MTGEEHDAVYGGKLDFRNGRWQERPAKHWEMAKAGRRVVEEMARSKPRAWTTKEEEYVRERYGKQPTKEIAEALGRKPLMVQSKANHMGLYIKGRRKTTTLKALKQLFGSVE